MIALADAVRHARLAVIATALDAAEAGGLIRIYSAPRPLPGAATGATLLVEARLPKPCWTTIDNGTLVFGAIPDALAQRTGMPMWARLCDGDDRFIADLDAGALDSGSDLVVDPLPILAGGTVRFALAELVEP